MNPSPIPAKEKVLLCDLCALEGAQRLGVRKKPLKASSLARFARAHRVRREMQNIPSAEIREIIILPTLPAPDGARVTIPPRRGIRFAGMNPSPIPAKEKVLLCALCGLERPQGVGVRKKPLKDVEH